MKADNPLTQAFLARHPLQAARALERLTPHDSAALFATLPARSLADTVGAMLPGSAAASLAEMAPAAAAKLLEEIPAPAAARIYRPLAAARQEEISSHLSTKTRRRLLRLLDYAALTAGDLMDSSVYMLTGELTVAETLRRIERLHEGRVQEIFVVDDAHRYLGIVDLGVLLASDHHATLRAIMQSRAPSVSSTGSALQLLDHIGWAERHRLAVVERDGTLVGVLELHQLREATQDEARPANDPLETALSLAGLYWLSVSQLLDTFLGIASAKGGERQ